MHRRVEISHKTIVFITVFVASLWFLFQIRDILFLLFISFILMAALNPFVDRLEKLRVPRALGIVMIYLVLWGFLGGLIAGIIPGFVEQTTKLVNLLPSALSQVDFFNENQAQFSEQIITRIGALPENILKVIVGLFGNILGLVTTLVVTFYLLLERKNLDKYFSIMLGEAHHPKATRAVNEIERRLGGWVRGELILMLIVGMLTYSGLIVLGIDIAIPLAILAGLLEIIPNIGPVVSAVPAVLIGLSVSPLTAAATAALYFLVQFLENNLLVPNVMKKAVGVNPLVSIIALMIGFKLAGPLGAILSIPTVLIIQTIGLEFFSLKHLENL
ncbi:MAG: AI-2E family transporter, partial [Patescibacteria group bacterium]